MQYNTSEDGSMRDGLGDVEFYNVGSVESVPGFGGGDFSVSLRLSGMF